jgi:hypothetical protein
MELQLDCLPAEAVHVAGFDREDLGVLESNEAIMVETMNHFTQRLMVLLSTAMSP